MYCHHDGAVARCIDAPEAVGKKKGCLSDEACAIIAPWSTEHVEFTTCGHQTEIRQHS